MISLTKNQTLFRNDQGSVDPFKKVVNINSEKNFVSDNIAEQYTRYTKEKERIEEIMGVILNTYKS